MSRYSVLYILPVVDPAGLGAVLTPVTISTGAVEPEPSSAVYAVRLFKKEGVVLFLPLTFT